MYVPEKYRAPEPRALVRDYPFATLVTNGQEGPLATLTPVFFASDDAGENELIGHLSAANPQAATLHEECPGLVIFSGPHSYISASWYRERPTVPTWNYVSAQVRGTILPVDRDEDKIAILERTAHLLESFSPSPWTLADAPSGRVADLLPHITAFRMRIDDIAGATKLSQAQPASDRLGVIEALERRGRFGDGEIAGMMRSLDGLS